MPQQQGGEHHGGQLCGLSGSTMGVTCENHGVQAFFKVGCVVGDAPCWSYLIVYTLHV